MEKKLVNSPLGRDLASLLEQEASLMVSVDITTRECDGHAVVLRCGELDVVDAADVAAALAMVVASPRRHDMTPSSACG